MWYNIEEEGNMQYKEDDLLVRLSDSICMAALHYYLSF